MLAGAAFLPFLADWIINGDTSGHLQSIIVGSTLTIAGFQTMALAVVADLVTSHRSVSQQVLERVRKLELATSVEPTNYLESERTVAEKV